MSVIYCISNNFSDKKYIGRTTDLHRRLIQHKNDSFNKNCKRKYNTPFAKAIRKHGWENFSVEILYENEDEAKINEMEQYYIKKYNCYGDGGYNASKGGEFGYAGRIYHSKVEKEYDNIVSDLKEDKLSITDIANKYNVSKSYISDINTGYRLHKDGIDYPIRLSLEKKKLNLYPLIIDDLINTNLSMSKIAQRYNLHKDSISRINLGKTKEAHKYYSDFPIRK